MNTHIWIFVILMLYTAVCNAYWGTGTGQYHIQTDEGNERYFRYQTDNGQYRKEKRLQDGTVIGTDAWIDAAGFLRAKDYIADDQGYRILKSKTFYVGHGRSIEDAVRTFKSLPSNAISSSVPVRAHIVPVTTYRPTTIYSGLRTTTSRPSYSTTTISPPTTPQPISSTTYRPTTYTPIISTTHRPITSTAIPYNGFDYSTPQVFVRHHSQPLEENSYNSISHNDFAITTSRPIAVPSQTYLPPHSDNRNRDEQIKPIAVISSTPSPISSKDAAYISSTLIPPLSSPTPFSTAKPAYKSTSTPYYSTTYRSNYPISSVSPSDYHNHISTIQPIHSTTSRPNYESPTIGSIVPIEDNDITVKPLYSRQPIASIDDSYKLRVAPLEYNNNLGSGYDPQFPEYDGISLNRNGFSYYLPKQYHEEDNRDPNYRRGSFGYIDPFGIRRVTYYNTAPGEGFVHRKNNRYVGHDATPYDPRPI
ncbi:mucin-5AC [Condylostylus longicornis]|uniref:mucin-5AC n=1 Tax=Condylostylus longicornis TaxID=2530218 RepID=UPI00244E1D35|nr:mucin-5AC [Condylostylus longicornis]XP_055378755.1 mucin-5AC [Condylostylus longicornis]XP_055378756.1 mucin-5AC [Condylostylus longicornis]